jgi:hypothetical protein
LLDSIYTTKRIGGAEAMALEICGGLNRDRFQPYLCLSRWDPGIEHEQTIEEPLRQVREEGIPILRLGRRSTASVGAWRGAGAVSARSGSTWCTVTCSDRMPGDR